MTSPRRDEIDEINAIDTIDQKAPHEPLTSYYSDEPARRLWLRGIFDRTASDYDAIERSYREATRLLGIVDAILEKHDYLAQDRFTVADIGVGLAAHRWVQLAERFPDTLGAQQPLPSLDRWLRAIKARPAFSVAVAS